MPVGFWARGWRTTASGARAQRGTKRAGPDPGLVHLDGHDLGAQRLDEVVEGREAGGLERDPVAEVDALLEHARDPVGGAVDDGDHLGRVGPGRLEHRAQLGQHGLVLVDAGARRGPRPGRRRARGSAAARDRGCRARGPSAGRRGWRRPARAAAGSATHAVSRARRCPSVRARPTTPVRRSACQAALTVAGLTPSSAATSRTVGSRSPGPSSPDRIARPNAPAMPCGDRSVSVARSGERLTGTSPIGPEIYAREKHGKCSTKRITFQAAA